MIKKQCSYCCFTDCCTFHSVCKHYAPVGEDGEASVAEDMMAATADAIAAFACEWYQYISEYD